MSVSRQYGTRESVTFGFVSNSVRVYRVCVVRLVSWSTELYTVRLLFIACPSIPHGAFQLDEKVIYILVYV